MNEGRLADSQKCLRGALRRTPRMPRPGCCWWACSWSRSVSTRRRSSCSRHWTGTRHSPNSPCVSRASRWNGGLDRRRRHAAEGGSARRGTRNSTVSTPRCCNGSPGTRRPCSSTRPRCAVAAVGVWWMGLGISLEADGRPADARDAFQRAGATRALSRNLIASWTRSSGNCTRSCPARSRGPWANSPFAAHARPIRCPAPHAVSASL